MTENVYKPLQTRGEELANTLSHGAGALLALAGAVYLAVSGFGTGSAIYGCSLTLYGCSLVLLYTASALYHGVQTPKIKRWLLFLTNAVLAGVGILLNIIDLQRFDKVCLVLYALMGWLVILTFRRMVLALPPLGLALLVGGGVAYTVGILFYKARRRYMHFVWHLFVLLGSVLQYLCVALYCRP